MVEQLEGSGAAGGEVSWDKEKEKTWYIGRIKVASETVYGMVRKNASEKEREKKEK